MNIAFNQPKTITISPAITTTVESVDVALMTDFPMEKRVCAQLKQGGNHLLWEGDAYDAAGQWTDADVEARLREIIG